MDNLNWIAIITGTIASFLLGWVLYSPGVFGRKWAEGSRVELGSASSMPVFAMATQLVALFALSLVIGITATTNSLGAAIAAIIAAALFAVSGGAFIKKTGYALAVDGGYIIAAGVLMIAAQALF